MLSIRKIVLFAEQNTIPIVFVIILRLLKAKKLKTSVMKKSYAQFAVLAVLVLVSLFSYIYLTTRNASQPDLSMETPKENRLDKEGLEAEQSSKYLLLDVEAVKKITAAVRKFLPASSY